MGAVIVGDPGAIEDAADGLGDSGTRLVESAEAIRGCANAVTARWTGAAADAAGQRIQLIGLRVLADGDAVVDAAPVYRVYAAELRGAQADYERGRAVAAARRPDPAAVVSSRVAIEPLGEAPPSLVGAAMTPADESARLAMAEGEAIMAAAVQRAAVANDVAARAIRAVIERMSGPTAPAVGDALYEPVGDRAPESAFLDLDWYEEQPPAAVSPRNIEARMQAQTSDPAVEPAATTPAAAELEGGGSDERTWPEAVGAWVWDHKVDIALTAALFVPGLGALALVARGARLAAGAYKAHRARRVADKVERLVEMNGKKHRVDVDEAAGRWRYDLKGRAHRGVPTPHKVWQPRNERAPHGWGKSEKDAKSMTAKDLRTVRRHVHAQAKETDR